MTDYERIARAIRFLDARRAAQPNLAAVAAHLGLSPAQFRRRFHTWAGATPKDLLQCLTLSHARHLLRSSTSALDSALSGPGRLHDLRVTLDAASPGEMKLGGAGVTLHAGTTATPFGNCLIARSPRGICHLSFFDDGHETDALAELNADWPNAGIETDQQSARRLASQIFAPPVHATAPLKLHVQGSPFQLRVWHALLAVPSGSLVSYGKLAAAAGNPAASRATGTAVGRNAVSFLIPCHRVIRQTGISGNYRWGPERKRAILAWEQART